jgi:threonine aldolase
MSELDERFRAAYRGCTTFPLGRGSEGPATTFRRLAEAADQLGLDDEADSYGESGPVARLEREVAQLLGKPDAVLFVSGVMAQQAALRAWCDRTGTRRVALPDLSHLLIHEEDGPRRVHGFEMELLTRGREVPTAAHLDRIPGRLGAVLVELPLREAGCLLPTWDELVALSEAAHRRGVPLHADGARIWESQPFYDRPLPEIAGLVDSIYVSLYKGLAAPSGALVAGPEDLTAELRVWRRRLGGTLYRMTTQAVGGLVGLRDALPLMGEYVASARRLALALEARGLRCIPSPPHTNTFLVHVEGDAETLTRRLVVRMEADRVAVGSPWRPADVPGWAVTEVAVASVVSDELADEVAQRVREVVGG